MKFSGLSKIVDSQNKEKAKDPKDKTKKPIVDSAEVLERKKRIKDTRMKGLKKRIKDSLDGTETTEEAVEILTPYLESDDPKEVLETVVMVLAETIDALSDLKEEEEEETE